MTEASSGGQLDEDDSVLFSAYGSRDVEWEGLTIEPTIENREGRFNGTGWEMVGLNAPMMGIRGLEGRAGQMGMHFLCRHGKYPVMVEEERGSAWAESGGGT
jgi:hypothetical protein